jgi:hypothetical protein
MVFAVISASPADWLKMAAAAAFVFGLVLAAWAANKRQRASSSGPARDWIKVKNPDSPAMIQAREAGVVTRTGTCQRRQALL